MTAGLEAEIARWRGFLRRRRALDTGDDLQELEAHLRDEIAALAEAGLREDEAFLVAIRRLGNLDALSREFAQEHSDRLWKQLVHPERSPRPEALVVLGLAVAAAAAVKAPELFGRHINGADVAFYQRNASLLVLPLLAIYFVWKRRLGTPTRLLLAGLFAAGAVFANVYPFAAVAGTQTLTALHLPIALWLVVGIAYAGGARMNFVRFSGELFLYFVLLALGGAVVAGFTMMMFQAIGLNAGWFVGAWLVPCGAAGALLVAAWLVEAKQSVIENMAPVLTRVFTPLLAAILLAFLGTMAWTGHAIAIQRQTLIAFDLLLALVVALVLYAVSARDPQSRPDWFDTLQLVLVASALAADGLALAATAHRIDAFGSSPNRVAALGENLFLLANLLGLAWYYWRFLRGKQPFSALERWQMSYLPAYSLWAAVVVVVFPPLFGFR